MSALRLHADETEGLYVVELVFEPNGMMDEHDAPHPILLIVTSGGGTVRINGVDSTIAAGESSFWPAGTLHQVIAGERGLRAIAIEYGLRAESSA